METAGGSAGLAGLTGGARGAGPAGQQFDGLRTLGDEEAVAHLCVPSSLSKQSLAHGLRTLPQVLCGHGAAAALQVQRGGGAGEGQRSHTA